VEEIREMSSRRKASSSISDEARECIESIESIGRCDLPCSFVMKQGGRASQLGGKDWLGGHHDSEHCRRRSVGRGPAPVEFRRGVRGCSRWILQTNCRQWTSPSGAAPFLKPRCAIKDALSYSTSFSTKIVRNLDQSRARA
jgi:hypothetical protein